MSKFIPCTICNKAEEYPASYYEKVYGEIPYKCTICCGGKIDPERAFFHLNKLSINDVVDKEKLYSLIWSYHYLYHAGDLEMSNKEWQTSLRKAKVELGQYALDYLWNTHDYVFIFSLIEAGETERIINEWLKYESNELEDEADLDPVPHTYE